MSGQNESDLPVFPHLKFAGEEPHAVGDLPSPTACFGGNSAEPSTSGLLGDESFKREVKSLVLDFLRRELS